MVAINDDAIKSDISFLLKRMLSSGLLAILSCGGFAFWITRLMTVPLNDAFPAAKRVANDDLTGGIEIKSRDEAGELLSALAAMNNACSSFRHSQ